MRVMKVLVVGGGGREHALAWKLSRERGVDRGLSRARAIPASRASRASSRRRRRSRRARSRSPNAKRIDLTVVGPELPLDRGIVDLFRARGLRIFGPPRAAAQLECSKVFAKDFMARHGIPTARYRVCDDAADGARGRRVGRARLPGRRQGGRPRGRQGRGRRAGSRRQPTPRSAPRWRSGSSATPARASCSRSA